MTQVQPELLQRLENVRETATGWSACCPAHGDRHASLSVSIGNDGRILLHCHAGCTPKDIVATVGLDLKDLFATASPYQTNGTTSEKSAKKIHPTMQDAIEAMSWHRGRPAGQWIYRDANRQPVGAVLRWNAEDGGKTILPLAPCTGGWQSAHMPVPRPLYRLPELRASEGPVYVVEGEKCADYAAKLGLTATTSAGGSKAAKQTDWSPLAGRDVVVLPDHDEPGEKYADDVLLLLGSLTPRPRVKIVRLPGLPDSGDICDFMDAAENPAAIVQEIQRLERETASPEKADHGYTFSPLTSAEFFKRDYRPTWLVKRLLVAGQPAVLGGPMKCLKTGIAIDLALSLGTGTGFLGTFEVYRKVRVALLSGESGEHTIQETARRIAKAKGIDPATADVLWGFKLPQLGIRGDLDALAKGLREQQVAVLLLDPLYLALLAGLKDVSASNLYQIGPLLMAVACACLDTKCTPVLIHHTTKHVAPGEPIDLDDLAFAGIAEFARQWLLLSRQTAFVPDTGIHQLWLSVGGSTGQCGLWGVTVSEGRLGEDFAGRSWDLSLMPAGIARQESKSAKDEAKEAKLIRETKQDANKLLAALDKLAPNGGTAGYTMIRDTAGLGGPRMIRAVRNLIDDLVIQESPHEIMTGKNMKVKQVTKGLRRWQKPTGGTDGQEMNLTVSPASPTD